MGPKHMSLPDYYDDAGNKYFIKEAIRKKYPRGKARNVTGKEFMKGLEGVYLKTRTPNADDFAIWFRKRKQKN